MKTSLAGFQVSTSQSSTFKNYFNKRNTFSFSIRCDSYNFESNLVNSISRLVRKHLLTSLAVGLSMYQSITLVAFPLSE